MEREFNKSDWSVRSIDFSEIKEWCLFKHYAHRMPMVSYAFGLYDTATLTLQGIVTYGVPASYTLVRGAFGGKYIDRFLELNRLCVNEGLPRNTLSYLVSQSLGMLPRPMVVVSFADTEQNHHGYIYQATNRIYTGLSVRTFVWKVRGLENKHNRHILDRDDENEDLSYYEALVQKYGDRVYRVERPRKHRYFYLLGSKTDRKKMREALQYGVEPYPKGDNSRYDASYETHSVGVLF